MYQIAHVGSNTSGHDSCPPTTIVTGDSTVLLDGDPIAVVGSTCSPHGCKAHPTHTPVVTEGSDFLMINGIPAARVGNKVAGGGCTSEHVITTANHAVYVQS